MPRFVFALLVASCLVIAACQQTETAQPVTDTAVTSAAEPARADPAAARRDIEQIRDQWISAAERDDAAAVAALYTEDAVVTSPESADAAEGRQAIQQLWERDFPLASDLQIRSSDTEVSGDLAYDYGEFTQRVTPPQGQPTEVKGRYLVVLKRQDDGGWKIDKHLSFPFPQAPPARQRR